MGTRFIDKMDLVDEFAKIHATGDIQNEEFMVDFAMNRIGIFLEFAKLNDKMKKVNSPNTGGMNCDQYPEEMAKFLMFIYNNRHRINSYCEIGIFHCGMIMTIDSLLRATNPDFKGSIGVDTYISGSLLQYIQKYKTTRAMGVSSQNLKLDEPVDMCFIDADHSYESAKHDYELACTFTKEFIAVHDIHTKSFGHQGYRHWEELRVKKIEILNKDLENFPDPMGIGIIDRRDE